MNLIYFFFHFKGATCVFLYNFELEVFCRTIQDYKVNIAPIVPTMVLHLVKDPIARQYDLSSLKFTICGAAPLSKELSNDYVKIFNNPIKQVYGTYS